MSIANATRSATGRDWKKARLGDICRPKQWETISKINMTPEGYPVYGANGQIGFYDKFNHEHPTIVIGCRGSCGTVHITLANSYTTGNVMALDDLDYNRISLEFLYHYLRKRGFRDIISGTSQPQITSGPLKNIEIPLPPLEDQRRIAAILDKAASIRRYRARAITKADAFLRSVFLELFGDPVSNSKRLPLTRLGDLAKVVTGNTPPRASEHLYGDGIEWIKSDNITTEQVTLTEAKERLSREGEAVARIVPAGSTLVTCIAGSPSSIGNAALADRRIAFNQQINAAVPLRHTRSEYLYALFRVGKPLVQRASTNSMKGLVSKSKFEAIEVPNPSVSDQSLFADVFMRYRSLQVRALHGLKLADDQFDALSQRLLQ